MRFESFVESSRSAKTVGELAQLYAHAVAEEGYENCVLTSLRGRKLGHIGWFEFPDGYIDAYVQNRWERIDPVLSSSLRAARPFFWNDAVERAKLSGEQVEFMGACRELKVHSGIIFPFHAPNQRLEVISISRRVTDTPAEECVSLLHAISVQAWNRYQEITEEQLFVEPDVVLTPRELDVLRWCKDGKTRQDIGEILTISRKTVEFHLRNSMDKLGASNQVSAVVMALQRGLIDL